MAEKYRIGVIGADNLIAAELIRIAIRHVAFRITALTSEKYEGRPFSDLFPAFYGLCDLAFTRIEPDAIRSACDIVFVALPPDSAEALIPELLNTGLHVLDLSRLLGTAHADTVKPWQDDVSRRRGGSSSTPFPCPCTPGLPELNRSALSGAMHIIAADCCTTAMLLALTPLLENHLISERPVVASAIRGTIPLPLDNDAMPDYCMLAENCRTLSIRGQAEANEICRELLRLTGQACKPLLSVHMAPFKRGLLLNLCALPPTANSGINGRSEQLSDISLNQFYNSYYRHDAFVRILPHGHLPEISAVRGTNYVDIAPFYDADSNVIRILTCLDHLGKGGVSQSVQALNVALGFAETEGLGGNIGC